MPPGGGYRRRVLTWLTVHSPVACDLVSAVLRVRRARLASRRYRRWAARLQWQIMKVNLPREDNDDYKHKVETYRPRNRWASVSIPETVDFQWLPIITANKMPPHIWKAFQDKFA